MGETARRQLFGWTKRSQRHVSRWWVHQDSGDGKEGEKRPEQADPDRRAVGTPWGSGVTSLLTRSAGSLLFGGRHDKNCAFKEQRTLEEVWKVSSRREKGTESREVESGLL